MVEIEYFDEALVKARVSGYGLALKNLGTDAFSYTCDEQCHDWLYQGTYLFFLLPQTVP